MMAEEFPVHSLSLIVVQAKGLVDGVKRQDCIWIPLTIGSVAAPAILCWVWHHVGSYWIEFDIAVAGEDVVLFPRDGRSETPLPECAAAAGFAVLVTAGVLDEALPQSLHYQSQANSSCGVTCKWTWLVIST